MDNISYQLYKYKDDHGSEAWIEGSYLSELSQVTGDDFQNAIEQLLKKKTIERHTDLTETKFYRLKEVK